MLVYDVSDRSSLDALDHWIGEMKTEVGNASEMDNVVFVVCANKVGKDSDSNVQYLLSSIMRGSQEVRKGGKELGIIGCEILKEGCN